MASIQEIIKTSSWRWKSGMQYQPHAKFGQILSVRMNYVQQLFLLQGEVVSIIIAGYFIMLNYQGSNPDPFPEVYEPVSSLKKSLASSMYSQPAYLRSQIIAQLRDTEIEYVVKLKIINLRIRMPLANELGEPEHKVEAMFGELEDFITLHSNFIDRLDEIVLNPPRHDELVVRAFRTFLQNLNIYANYFSGLPATIAEMDEICIKNKQKVAVLFEDFNEPLQSYLTVPTKHITTYESVMKKYLEHLPLDHRNHKLLQEEIKIYKFILTNKLTEETLANEVDSQVVKILQKEQSHLKGIEVVFSSKCTIGNQQMMIFVVKNSENGCIAIMRQDSNFPQLLEKSCLLKMTEATFFYKFACTLTMGNRIGILSYDKAVIVSFPDLNLRELFNNKCGVLKCGVALKDQLHQYPFEARTYNFSVVVTLCGMVNRQAVNRAVVTRYVLKFYLHRNKVCQFVFISQQGLQKILQIVHKKNNIKDQFEMASSGFFGIFYSDTVSEDQKSWVNLEDKLNHLFRVPQIRNNPEYLLQKLRIFEGLYQLIRKNERVCGCVKCQQKQQRILKPLQVFQQYESGISDPEQQPSEQECFHKLLKHRAEINKMLYTDSLILQPNCKFSSYQQKLKFALLEMQTVNWKFNVCYRRLREPRPIGVYYYSIEGIRLKVQVPQIYEEETVEQLIRKIYKELRLDFYEDFCLYSRSSEGELFEYDLHQYLKDIGHGINNLHLGKRFLFSPAIEESLLENSVEKVNRVQLVVGQAVAMIQQHEVLSDQLLKKYLLNLLELLMRLKKTKMSSLTSLDIAAVKPYLNMQQHVKESSFLAISEKLDELLKQDRSIEECYSNLMEVLHYREIMGVSVVKGIQIIPSKACSKVYTTVKCTCSFNYDKLMIRPDNETKTQRTTVIGYKDYLIECVGSHLYFRSKINPSDEPVILKTDNSFTVLSKLRIYQKMYEDNPKVTSSSKFIRQFKHNATEEFRITETSPSRYTAIQFSLGLQ